MYTIGSLDFRSRSKGWTFGEAKGVLLGHRVCGVAGRLHRGQVKQRRNRDWKAIAEQYPSVRPSGPEKRYLASTGNKSPVPASMYL